MPKQADEAQGETEFYSKHEKLPSSVQEACDGLLNAVKEVFPKGEYEPKFRGRGYHIMAQNNFFSFEPMPSYRAVRVVVHANRQDLPGIEDFFASDTEHNDGGRKKSGPRVQSILMKKAEDIPKMIEFAKIAREKWGKGER